MKKRFAYIALIFTFSVTLFVVPIVSAESTIYSGTNRTSPGAPATTPPNQSSTPTTSEQQIIKDRIQALKTKLKIQLTAIQADRIKTRCAAAQEIVKTLNARVNTNSTIRTQAYQDITSDLNNLVAKLKAKNVDATQLEQEITSLGSQILTYKTSLTTYQQDLNDLVSYDCTTDPAGFQAALVTARNDRATLSTTVLGIRSYATTTVKPTLTTIRTLLSGQNTSSSNEGSH